MQSEETKPPLLDRFLTLWIFVAMTIGVGVGAIFPEITTIFDVLRTDTVSLPIAIGLLWIMYPLLAKVKYEELSKVAKAWKRVRFNVSPFLNWTIGLFLMFGPTLVV